jgi:flagellar protein FlgJ
MILNTAKTAAAPTPDKPALNTAVKHLAGVLWDEMLQAMNQNGMDTSALGTGSDAFQGMFMWDIAQNDFGKYDSGLLDAMQRQVGGTAGIPPAIAEAGPVDPYQMLTSLGQTAPAFAPAIVEAVQAASPDAAPVASTQLAQAKKFAQAIWPQITAAAQQLGVPAASILAQSALETGWGVSAPGNNLFGIKAAPGQSGTSRSTLEMVDGVLQPQTARFRDYASTADSINDYVETVKSAFTKALGQSSVNGFATAMQAGGYATDANYAHKIINLSQSPLMQQVLAAVTGKLTQAQPELTATTERVSK